MPCRYFKKFPEFVKYFRKHYNSNIPDELLQPIIHDFNYSLALDTIQTGKIHQLPSNAGFIFISKSKRNINPNFITTLNSINDFTLYPDHDKYQLTYRAFWQNQRLNYYNLTPSKELLHLPKSYTDIYEQLELPSPKPPHSYLRNSTLRLKNGK